MAKLGDQKLVDDYMLDPPDDLAEHEELGVICLCGSDAWQLDQDLVWYCMDCGAEKIADDLDCYWRDR